MSDDTQEIMLLSTPPAHEPLDVDMTQEGRSSPSGQAATEELSRLTSLSLTDKKIQPYVEVKILTPEEKAKYATDLAERLITSDEEFPEEHMERVIGEYSSGSELYYFVMMTSGIAFKVRIDTYITPKHINWHRF